MELKFDYKGINISAWLTENSEKSILFIPGLPQYITKYHPIVKNLTELGYNLFTPQYYGSWDSKNDFSIEDAIKTVRITIEFVKSCSDIELYNKERITWKNRELYVIGYSFGALPTLANIDNIENLILIAPFVNYKIHKENNGEDLEKTFTFLNRAYKNNYRFTTKKLLYELCKYDYNKLIRNDKVIKVIYGIYDKVIPIEEVEWLKKNFIVREHKLEIAHSSDISKEKLQEVLSNEKLSNY